jgi:hypothetical protein
MRAGRLQKSKLSDPLTEPWFGGDQKERDESVNQSSARTYRRGVLGI